MEDRTITEWDSSCCLIALTKGTVIRIPDSDLVLPSVTIKGLVRIPEEVNVPLEERNMTYGELTDLVKKKQIATICSVGTAGILNTCSRLLLIDNQKNKLTLLESDPTNPLYKKLADVKNYYWEIYKGTVKTSPGLNRTEYQFTV